MVMLLRPQMTPMPKVSQANKALALAVTVKGETESPGERIRIFHAVF